MYSVVRQVFNFQPRFSTFLRFCFTPDLYSVFECSSLITVIKLHDIPILQRIFHNTFQFKLSKAPRKSKDGSMMILIILIWSMQNLFERKPACFFLSPVSIFSFILVYNACQGFIQTIEQCYSAPVLTIGKITLFGSFII